MSGQSTCTHAPTRAPTLRARLSRLTVSRFVLVWPHVLSGPHRARVHGAGILDFGAQSGVDQRLLEDDGGHHSGTPRHEAATAKTEAISHESDCCDFNR